MPLLEYPIAAFCMAILMPASITPMAWILLLVTTVALYRFMMGDGFRIARRLGLIKPASPRLTMIMQRLSE